MLLADLCLREVVWFDLDVSWALLFWVSAVCVFEVFCCRRDGLNSDHRVLLSGFVMLVIAMFIVGVSISVNRLLFEWCGRRAPRT